MCPGHHRKGFLGSCGPFCLGLRTLLEHIRIQPQQEAMPCQKPQLEQSHLVSLFEFMGVVYRVSSRVVCYWR